MRVSAFLLGLVVASSLAPAARSAAASSSASASGRDRCGLRGARVVERGGSVSVVAVRSVRYACDVRSGRRTRLASVSSTPSGYSVGLGQWVIRGRYLAYVQTNVYHGTDLEYFVGSVDARSGRRVLGVAGPVDFVYGLVPDPVVRRLALAADGTVAWTVVNPFQRPARHEVHRRRGRTDALVASGPGVDLSLLIVSDGLVIWRQDGRLESVPVVG